MVKKTLLLFAAFACLTNFCFSQVKEADWVWTEFVSVEGRFKVSFPGKPRTETGETAIPGGSVKHTRTLLTYQGINFMVMWSDSHGGVPKTDKELKDHYDKLQGIIVSKPGRTLIFDREARSDGRLGRDFAFSSPAEINILKVFVVDNRLYQAIANFKISESDKSRIAQTVRFFDSFSLLK